MVQSDIWVKLDILEKLIIFLYTTKNSTRNKKKSLAIGIFHKQELPKMLITLNY